MNSKTNRRTFNDHGLAAVKRIGVNHFSVTEIYNSLIMMTWPTFFLLLLFLFLCLTFSFTVINAVVGFEHFTGIASSGWFAKFCEIFLYNAQTLTTVGSENIIPVGFLNKIILTIESMTAMIGAAVITGLLYARFSRPCSGIIYSTNLLVAPYRAQGKALMLRIANKKKNEVVEVHARFYLVTNELATLKREVKELQLERHNIPLLAHTWTLVHPITTESPLYDFEWKDNNKVQYEIMAWFSGTDRITGQNVFSGRSYLLHEVMHNARFTPCLDVNDDDLFVLHLNRVADYEMV
jgi:inward rectifier potassium channel